MIGFHVTTQANGAFPNGTKICKVWSEKDDANAPGTLGRVLGSLGPLKGTDGQTEMGYFVEWDSTPGVAVFVIGSKIKALPGEGWA